MSSFLGNRGVRIAVLIGLGAAGVFAAPAACLYPEHTFNEAESGPSGGGAGKADAGPTEACGNGIDDNGDGLVDCEDPTCGAFACEPELTAGWTGYYAIFEGAPADDPGCSGGFTATTPAPFVGNDGLSAPPAVCTCSCGAAEGQECARLDTINITVNDAACGSSDGRCFGPIEVPANWTGACHNEGFFPGGLVTCGPSAREDCSTRTGAPCDVSATVSALPATGGMCTPTPGVQKPALTWAKLGRACAAAQTQGKGCNVGQVCLPKPTAPFGSGICIAQDGGIACPPGAYTSQHILYTDAADTRDCEGCSCSAPSGGSCPTTVSLYSDTPPGTCTTKIAEVPAGSCVALNNNPTVAGHSASAPGAPTGATCTPGTATPRGEVKAINPKTFCCIP